MSSEVVITVKNVSKDFRLNNEKNSTTKSKFVSFFRGSKRVVPQKQHALKDISFEIKKGEFFGIVGRNGSGKSTLLKILAGIYQPNQGSVDIKGKLVPFIELGVGFNPELTGRENVFLNGALLGFDRREIENFYDEVVEFAELSRFMDKKLKNYSSGMQVRLAFAMAVRADADILLIDEVLAVGDSEFQRKCFDYFRQLKKHNKTVVFVSHDMDSVKEYCDRAVLLENSYMEYMGSSSEVATEYIKLFVDEVVQEQDGMVKQESGGVGKRYGDQKLSIIKTNVDKKRYISIQDPQILISVDVQSNKETSNSIAIGFMIKNSSGIPVIGSNSTIEGIKIAHLAQKEIARIEWSVPNIFGRDKYFIDIAVTSTDGTINHDWWEGCASFSVAKEKNSPYVVSPNIPTKVTYKR